MSLAGAGMVRPCNGFRVARPSGRGYHERRGSLAVRKDYGAVLALSDTAEIWMDVRFGR